jgi:hypothetical protein
MINTRKNECIRYTIVSQKCNTFAGAFFDCCGMNITPITMTTISAIKMVGSTSMLFIQRQRKKRGRENDDTQKEEPQTRKQRSYGRRR